MKYSFSNKILTTLGIVMITFSTGVANATPNSLEIDVPPIDSNNQNLSTQTSTITKEESPDLSQPRTFDLNDVNGESARMSKLAKNLGNETPIEVGISPRSTEISEFEAHTSRVNPSSSLVRKIRFNLSGYDQPEINDAKAQIQFDPSVVRDIGMVNDETFKMRSYDKKTGLMVVDILKPVAPASTLEFEVTPFLNQVYGIPRNVEIPISVMIVDSSGSRISNIAESSLTVTGTEACVLIQAPDGKLYYADDYDYRESDGERFVQDTLDESTRNSNMYDVYFKSEWLDRYSRSVARHVESATLRIKRPKYRVSKHSETYLKTGDTARATLNEQMSDSGWSIDGDYFVYSGPVNGSSIPGRLYVRYPGLVLDDSRTTIIDVKSDDLNADYDISFDLIPKRNDRYRNEPSIHGVNQCGNFKATFRRDEAPWGFSNQKTDGSYLISKEHGGRYQVDEVADIDSIRERIEFVRWTLKVSQTRMKEQGEIAILDKDLDDSLRYAGLLNKGLIDARAELLDDNGSVIEILDLPRKTNADVSNPESDMVFIKETIRDQVKSIRIISKTIEYSSDSKMSEAFVFAELKDRKAPLMSDSQRSRAICNSLYIEPAYNRLARQNSRVSKSCVKTRLPKNSYRSQKIGKVVNSHSGAQIASPGSLIDYTINLGFTEEVEPEGDGSFEIRDLLPDGVRYLDGSLTSRVSIPLRRSMSIEVIDDYHGTGRQMLKINSGALDDSVRSYWETSTTNEAVSFRVKIDEDRIDLSKITNDAYVRFEGAEPRQYDRFGGEIYNGDMLEGDYAWMKRTHSLAVSTNSGMLQSKSIAVYKENGSRGDWQNDSTGSVKTRVGEKMDYRIRLVNGYDTPRTGVVVYDVFPFIGDQGIPGVSGINHSRQSSFSNKFDTTRQITIPPEYEISYYNGPRESLKHDGTRIDAGRKMESLNWESSPGSDVAAVRIKQRPGESIPAKSTQEIILPFIAGRSELIDEYGDPSVDENAFARNSVYYRDSELTDVHGVAQDGLIEGSSVSNTLVHIPITMLIHKKGIENSPLQGAEFALQNEKGETVSTATSDENGLVEFTEPKPKGGWKIVETRAPDTYVKSSQEITLSSEQIKNARLNNDGVLDLGEFVNTQDPVRFPLTLPMTGDNPVLTLLVGSGLILLGGSALYLWMNRARIFSTNGGDRFKKH